MEYINDMNNIEMIDISEIKPNPQNPRVLNDGKFKKLVRSIKEFPKMMEIRPVVIDERGIILGGNMRFKACQKAGLKTIPIIRVENMTEAEKAEFIIKDNLNYGDWDFEILNGGEWDKEFLLDWGLELPTSDDGEGDFESKYTKKIEAPIYQIRGEKPLPHELTELDVWKNLVAAIEEADIEEEVKAFMLLAATRHIKFDYSKCAEFYAHSDEKIQRLMEKLVLVIIDFDKAIELGYLRISEKLINEYKKGGAQ